MTKAQQKAKNDEKERLFEDERPDKPLESDPDTSAKTAGKPWKVMIIDDDDVVHQVTLMVLADYTFGGRPIEIIQGYSGGAGRNLMKRHPDTAVILLDVVMETDSAGLDTVKYIRDVLHNQEVRIVIRTGQPGQVPEQSVINDQAINGYVAKTEMTAQKLFSCLTASLRAYRDVKDSAPDDVHD